MKKYFFFQICRSELFHLYFTYIGELASFKGHMILLDRIHVFRFAIYSKIVTPSGSLFYRSG